MTDAGTLPLLARLADLPLRPGQVALWWLGQAGFALRGEGMTLLIDPFLAEEHDRAVPPAFLPEQAVGVDAILCTHDHIDHLDAESLPGMAAASPGARLVVPRPVVSRVTDLGIDAGRVIGAQPGEQIDLGSLTIHPVPAWHGVHVDDAYNLGDAISGGMVRYLGFVLSWEGVVLYHSGDTLAYPGQAAMMRDHNVQVALLPINGRDQWRESRDLVGNMDVRDAAHLAAEALVDVLVPMHYDMFAGNLGFPGHLVEFNQREGLDLTILLPGYHRPVIYTGTRG